MTIQLVLDKHSDSAPISFNLSKVQHFIVKLFWETNHDLDVHAIQLQQSKIKQLDDVLSTYNPNLVLVDNVNTKHLSGGTEPFRNVSGSLIHNGDRRTGLSIAQQEPDEVIEVYLDKIPQGKDEVSFFIGSHPPQSAKFRDVKGCKLVIEDDQGKQLLVANLSDDWDEFDMVQMGGLVLDNGEWKFSSTANGINGNFNDVLAMLS